MKLVFHFKVGDFATGEISLHGKIGGDLTPDYDNSDSEISYQALAKVWHVPNEYKIANVELRLVSGKKILKRKPISNSDKTEE